jgi:hypothetical protein
LTQIVRLMNGCQAVVDNKGIEAFVAVLMDAPTQASQCILEISRTLAGSRAILARSREVLAQLAQACQVGPNLKPVHAFATWAITAFPEYPSWCTAANVHETPEAYWSAFGDLEMGTSAQ